MKKFTFFVVLFVMFVFVACSKFDTGNEVSKAKADSIAMISGDILNKAKADSIANKAKADSIANKAKADSIAK